MSELAAPFEVLTQKGILWDFRDLQDKYLIKCNIIAQNIQSQKSSRTNGTFSNPKNPSSDNEKDELGALNIFARDDILIVSNPKNPSSDNEKDELRALNIFARDDVPKVSNPKNPPVQTGLSAIPKIRVQTTRRMN